MSRAYDVMFMRDKAEAVLMAQEYLSGAIKVTEQDAAKNLEIGRGLSGEEDPFIFYKRMSGWFAKALSNKGCKIANVVCRPLNGDYLTSIRCPEKQFVKGRLVSLWGGEYEMVAIKTNDGFWEQLQKDLLINDQSGKSS